ncbi:hypothetical protein CLV92_106107 [Kineococcus xinjiangensis]|uniref:Uncharacterized protein n=2 Tax=Kineococcus xinjiangensis TaxID=512762 RepID=A0A2S6IMA3_9ACTN|nr:hypothetical protein CLV92_106107 [Kineococcus xinjiangensis]
MEGVSRPVGGRAGTGLRGAVPRRSDPRGARVRAGTGAPSVQVGPGRADASSAMSDTASAPRRSPVAPDPVRCPSCSARVRPRQEWCSLCHAALRPEPAVAPVPSAAPPAAGPAEPVGSAPGDPAPTAFPAGAEGEQLDLFADGPGAGGERPDVDAVAERLLAELAASTSRPVAASRGRQALMAAGGAAALTALILLVLTIVGLLV